MLLATLRETKRNKYKKIKNPTTKPTPNMPFFVIFAKMNPFLLARFPESKIKISRPFVVLKELSEGRLTQN